MDNPAVSGLRSRSRSNTPFLRSSCDRENCTEGGDHTHHKSGRKTPIKRSTPIKQLHKAVGKSLGETITEVEEENAATPAHRTRKSTKTVTEKLIKTSDYSSEESLDRLKDRQKEIQQNEINSRYERLSGSQFSTLADVTLSPIHTQTSHNVSYDRSTRFGSPAYSACSTDSSFAEQALADVSLLLDKNPSTDHLPYKLYKMAGEYWNKYPKTDYTYSPFSKDRVELAPGQVAVPNMSRRSLSQFRVHGPNVSVDELDRLSVSAWTSSARKRYTSIDSSDDEGRQNGYPPVEQRWWITRLLITIITTVTTTVSTAYRKVVGPSHRYPYTDRQSTPGIVRQAATLLTAPFYWIYTIIKKVVTTTVTTVTEIISSNHVSENANYKAHALQEQKESKRRWWPWLLLLLFPIVGYGSHYTYENYESLAMPNFTDFHLDLSEYAVRFPELELPSLPDIELPSLADIKFMPNFKMADLNVSKTYVRYRNNVQASAFDAYEYMKSVGDNSFQLIRRYWHGIIG